jgi:hypothetical protein
MQDDGKVGKVVRRKLLGTVMFLVLGAAAIGKPARGDVGTFYYVQHWHYDYVRYLYSYPNYPFSCPYVVTERRFYQIWMHEMWNDQWTGYEYYYGSDYIDGQPITYKCQVVLKGSPVI